MELLGHVFIAVLAVCGTACSACLMLFAISKAILTISEIELFFYERKRNERAAEELKKQAKL